MSNNDFVYRPWYPVKRPGETDRLFEKNFTWTCIQSVEEMREYFQEHKNATIKALDTETTGLTFAKDVICGFSFSWSAYDGIYIPIRHQLNSLPEETILEIVDYVQQTPTIFFNALFDMVMMDTDPLVLQTYSEKPSRRMKFQDAMILAFVADSNVKSLKLKPLAKAVLGRDVPDFKTTLGKVTNFSYTDPLQSAYYASCDSADTFGLRDFFLPLLIKECPFTLKLEHEITRAFIDHYNEQTVLVDTDYMKILQTDFQEELSRVESEIYVELGAPVKLNSTKELGEALLRLGIDTGKRTEKAKTMSLAKEDLLAIADQHPLAAKLVHRKGLDKQLGTYVKNLVKTGEGHISYRLQRAATGRLASGTGGKNKYYLPINMQNQTKPGTALFLTFPARKDDKEAIVGWRFFLWNSEKDEPVMEDKDIYMYCPEGRLPQPGDSPDHFLVEGLSPHRNIRKAFIAPKDRSRYFLSLDYSGEELRIPAGLSKDPVWYEPLRKGEDVHKALALAIYGEKDYDKDKRKKAKAGNFGLQYRGTYHVLMKLGMFENEARAFVTKFWKAMRILRAWQDRLIQKARRVGSTYSAYGRPRRVASYFGSPEFKWNSFGERTVVNHAVQGAAADALKIVLVNLWKTFFYEKDPNIDFHSTIHDEVNFLIVVEKLKEYLIRLLGLMEVTIPGSDLPLTLGIEIGWSYGEVYAFDFDPTKDGLESFRPAPA